MRAISSIFFFVVSVHAQTASSATLTAMNEHNSRCSQASSQYLVGNQACTQQIGFVSTSTGALDLSRFCGSSCMGSLKAMYDALSTCMLSYRPQLEANLQRDNVPNATQFADTMLLGARVLPNTFNFMCVRNERDEYCMPKWSQLSKDISTGVMTGNSTVCPAYGNLGCCFRALDLYFDGTPSSGTFSGILTRACPELATLYPPTCLNYGQKALALVLTVPLNGLVCDAFDRQSEQLKTNYQAALRTDLAAGGLNSSYTVIKSISQVNGVCTATVIVRAENDDATRALKTAASTASTVALTQSNQVLTVAPDTSNGNVKFGSAMVSETTLTGQSVGSSNSAAFAVPSALLGAVLLLAFY